MTGMPTLEAIARHLRDLVQGASLEELHDPGLLLYSTASVLVGFAIAGEDVMDSYEKSYESFKRVFSTTGRKGLEPSFVLCADARMADIEKLSSTIETDVYFCRKYVLPFSETIEHMLVQLPFLPLEPIGSPGTRPETAQTYLQLNGIPSELARHIVVPSQRSADSIVDLCLQGHYGGLKSDQAQVSRSAPSVAAGGGADGESIRVESLSIEGFRAYKAKTTFLLGERVTFLYGPNGFGKTSFFDAFDFAITGGVGRLGTDSRNADLQSLAVHLDAPSETSRVQMKVRFGDESTVIERSVRDAKNARIGGAKVDRKELLSRVTGAGSPSADRVENLVSLFRATHLFSQEQQELTKDMQEKSELSSEIVSRMLALDDYAAADSKLTSVIDVIASRRRGSVSRAEQAAIRASEAEKSISELVEKLGAGPQVDVSPLIASLELEASALGIAAKSGDSPVSGLRALRASTEYLLSQLTLREERIGELRARVSSRAQLIEQLTSANSDLARQRKLIVELEGEKARAEATKIAANQAVSDCAEIESKAAREYHRAEWARTNAPIYGQLLKQAEVIGSRLPEQAALVQARAQVANDAQAAVAYAESMLKTRQSELLSAEGRFSDAKLFQASAGKYPEFLLELEQVRAEVTRLQGENASIVAKAGALEAELGAAKLVVTKLDKDLRTQEREVSEVRSLIEQLRQHVHGAECPLCGHDHRTTDALLDRIARLDATDPLSGLREALREAKNAELSKVVLLDAMRSDADALGRLLVDAKAKLQSYEQQLAELEGAALSKGIRVSDQEDLPQAAQSYLEKCSQDVVSAREQLASLQRNLDEQRLHLSQCREALLEARATNDADNGRLSEIQRDSLSIERDSYFVQSEVLSPLEHLEARISKLHDEQVSASDKLQVARESLRSAEASLGAISANLSMASAAVGRLAEQSEGITRSVNAINNEIGHAGFTQDGDVTVQIDSSIQVLSKERSAAQALLDNVKSAELAVDAATTAAALEAHRATFEEQSKVRDSASRDAEVFDALHSYFRSIKGKVQAQRNASVSSFTTRYGPRTSVIQKRLRAVYGFEEVSITSAESRIVVSVSRQGKKLRPTDYFSQSQQQTLLLGLFLTACSSQTWSEFGPVLLDDPVAHFDDLNTYAFLDLVRGLLLDSGRQFVISTCDERFMQMAIRKFRAFGSQARFYRFQSIGADGPEVSEIENSQGGSFRPS